jgi:hypothetical protein
MNDDDLIKQRVELWKTTVDTQQHFNTLQLQLRNFALTLFLAIVGVAGIAIKEHFPWGAFVGCVAGLVIMAGFYQMDWGYHQLLKGAVTHGMEIESSLHATLPEAGLAGAITVASSAKRLFGVLPTRSTWRLNIFYGLLAVALMVLGVLALTVPWTSPSQAPQAAGQGAWNFSPVVGVGVFDNHNELGSEKRAAREVPGDAPYRRLDELAAPAVRVGAPVVGGYATGAQGATQTPANAPSPAPGTQE